MYYINVAFEYVVLVDHLNIVFQYFIDSCQPWKFIYEYDTLLRLCGRQRKIFTVKSIKLDDCSNYFGTIAISIPVTKRWLQ